MVFEDIAGEAKKYELNRLEGLDDIEKNLDLASNKVIVAHLIPNTYHGFGSLPSDSSIAYSPEMI